MILVTQSLRGWYENFSREARKSKLMILLPLKIWRRNFRRERYSLCKICTWSTPGFWLLFYCDRMEWVSKIYTWRLYSMHEDTGSRRREEIYDPKLFAEKMRFFAIGLGTDEFPRYSTNAGEIQHYRSTRSSLILLVACFSWGGIIARIRERYRFRVGLLNTVNRLNKLWAENCERSSACRFPVRSY